MSTPANIREAILQALGKKTVSQSALRAAVKKRYGSAGERLFDQELSKLEFEEVIGLVGTSGPNKFRRVDGESRVTAADLLARR